MTQRANPPAWLGTRANMRILYDGILGLGLTPWLGPERQGPVLVNVHAPADPAWDLQAFVDALKRREILISNFYNTPSPTFRVGCIGAITPDDMVGVVTGHRPGAGRNRHKPQGGRPGMNPDLEIARAAKLQPIHEIAGKLGIPDDAVEPYGRYKAKIGLDFIGTLESRPDGALVLVTGISPTPGGGGQDHHDGWARGCAEPDRQTRGDLSAGTEPGTEFRDEGRRGGRRICAGRADGPDQPALHRRFSRHHLGE